MAMLTFFLSERRFCVSYVTCCGLFRHQKAVGIGHGEGLMRHGAAGIKGRGVRRQRGEE